MPTYLESLKDYDLDSFLDNDGDNFYEFLLVNYPELIPNDEVILHELIDEITPEMLLEYFLEKGDVVLC